MDWVPQQLRLAMRKRVGMYLGDSAQFGLRQLFLELFDGARDLFGAQGGDIQLIALSSRKFGLAFTPFNPELTSRGLNATARQLTMMGDEAVPFEKIPYARGGLSLFRGAVSLSVASVFAGRCEWRVEHEGKLWSLCTRNSEPDGSWRVLAEPFAWQPAGHTVAVQFELDEQIWSPEASFHLDMLDGPLWDLAVLCPNLSFNVSSDGEARTYSCPGGLPQRFAEIAAAQEAVHVPLTFRAEREGVRVECAFAWTRTGKSIVESWVNELPAKGSHLEGALSASRRVTADLGSTRTGNDPFSFLLAVQVPYPTWLGPTKGRLADDAVRKLVEATVEHELRQALRNPELAAAVRDLLSCRAS